MYEVWSKNNHYFQSECVHVFNFCIFFCYIGIHVCYMRVCWQYQPLWLVSLFLTDKKVRSCFGVLFGVLLFEKMDQRNWNCIKFFIKNEIKCAKTFEILTVAFGEPSMSKTQVQLLYNWLKEGQADFNEDADRPSTSNIHYSRKLKITVIYWSHLV